jgi:hypothetical protein
LSLTVSVCVIPAWKRFLKWKTEGCCDNKKD